MVIFLLVTCVGVVRTIVLRMAVFTMGVSAVGVAVMGMSEGQQTDKVYDQAKGANGK